MNFSCYKQQTAQGCLVMCCLLAAEISPSLALEKELLIEGLTLFRDAYVIGTLLAFEKKTRNKIEVFVDNLYYAKKLQHALANSALDIKRQKVDEAFLDSTQLPLILNVDVQPLGSYSHQPHYVVLLGRTEKFFSFFDPWEGKTRRVKKELLLSAIFSLRTHLKYCPMAIFVRPLSSGI